jgi:hypothetical protein
MLQSAYIDAIFFKLLDTVEEVGFGEIFDVDVQPSHVHVHRQLSNTQLKFTEMVAGMGITHITKLTVHNGEPAVMEIDGTSHGMKYRRKLKI